MLRYLAFPATPSGTGLGTLAERTTFNKSRSKEQVHAPLGNPSDSPRGRSGASPSAPVVRFGKRSEAAKVQN